MAITLENGYQYIPAILSPQNSWAVAFGADGSMKISNNPFSTASMEATPSGLYYRAFSKSPTTTGSKRIVDSFTLPANLFSASTPARVLRFTLFGRHAANGNSTTTNINVGGTGAYDAAPTGGTEIFTDITNSTSGGGIYGQACIIRTGVSTQIATSSSLTQATALATLSTALSATETSAIQINLVQNAATAATDLPITWLVEVLF
jgi:hypothetical protein